MKDEGPDGHMHDGPIGHMCNEKVLIDDEAPKPRRILAPHEAHESTNLLLGFISGHLENLVAESNRANEGARRRNDEWQETMRRAGDIQVKAQRTGAIVVFAGICLMSTIISVVVSVVIGLL